MTASFKSIAIEQALSGFDDILDVRSPAEYAQDHLPGALNMPVLDDAERSRIGTLFVQVSPFEARRQGAAWVAANIAHHLAHSLSERPKGWRPLVYCWRGGMRSAAMAHTLAQVGWKTGQLAGGYKSYRQHVLAALEGLPGGLKFRVICGATGSGKSRLLQALAEQGAQVLDLEQLALHRGSLLGYLPQQPQPSQKMFETRLWQALRGLVPERPVYIEAESRKIGALTLPNALLGRMRASPCVQVEAPLEARLALLMQDYAHFMSDCDRLAQCLSPLIELHGRQVVAGWNAMAQRGAWQVLVEELLTRHYDPAYRRSAAASFEQLNAARVLRMATLDGASLRAAAQRLIDEERSP